jgi:hypothetical protein
MELDLTRENGLSEKKTESAGDLPVAACPPLPGANPDVAQNPLLWRAVGEKNPQFKEIVLFIVDKTEAGHESINYTASLYYPTSILKF